MERLNQQEIERETFARAGRAENQRVSRVALQQIVVVGSPPSRLPGSPASPSASGRTYRTVCAGFPVRMRHEYWPIPTRAVDILDTTRIPWKDPATGKGGLQPIVNVTGIPRGPGALDDPVRIVIDLPPGSGVGPVVSKNLAQYGVKSASLYRGLLNLAYHWFEPGRTRRPIRGGKHWLQVEGPKRYERISDDLMRVWRNHTFLRGTPPIVRACPQGTSAFLVVRAYRTLRGCDNVNYRKFWP